ncbi:electron transfer flavoprotein subunit alpha/FixB family protein [Myxococcota bacterium]|nr:electron transfer flavoprotein subunit alpha/FixB family protein [Myxococcota bacterium]MBU1537826.1 electron transfer flavoprotein subunit alpha/FixB family protein [Myxococcota bacterium]
MCTTLVLLELTAETINPLSLRALSAARAVSEDLAGLALGESASVARKACAYFPGVIHLVTSEEMGAEILAPALCQIMEQSGCTQLVAAATPFSRDLLPRVAALAGASFLSQLSVLEFPGEGKRAVLAGKGVVAVRSLLPVSIITIEPSAFPVAAPLAIEGEISLRTDPVEEFPGISRKIIPSAARGGPSLLDAAVVVGVGRGVGPVQSLPLPLAQLATLLGAAVGGTRATCDSGLFSPDLQIGQTGRVIAPECYIAIGVSGAVQHVAGVRGAALIVAIDKNELAGIFETADVGFVGMWEAVVPKLCELLGSNPR